MSVRPIPVFSPSLSSVDYAELPSNLDKLSPAYPDTTEVDAAWAGLAPLLNHYGIWLLGTEEYKNNPPAPTKDPLDPFHTQDEENFVVFCAGDKAIRYYSDPWQNRASIDSK